MYKLVVSDMDGTLLNKDFLISLRTQKAIKAAAEKGVIFTIATGRIYGSARIYAKEIGLESAILCCNGAVAKNADDKKLLFSSPIPHDICSELFRQFEKDGTFFQFYAEEVFYFPKRILEAKFFQEWCETLPGPDRIPTSHVPNPYEVIGKDPIYKIFIKSEGAERRKYHQELLEQRDDITFTSSWDNNFEITAAGVNKGQAVLRYAELLGIDRSEIICVGDNHNDIDMIKAAGLGVAMGNASDEIKNIAGFVTDTYDNDGVAKMLEKFVL